jgi:hypothetical protein
MQLFLTFKFNYNVQINQSIYTQNKKILNMLKILKILITYLSYIYLKMRDDYHLSKFYLQILFAKFFKLFKVSY